MRSLSALILLIVAGLLLACRQPSPAPQPPATPTSAMAPGQTPPTAAAVATGPVLRAMLSPPGPGADFDRQIAAMFEAETGVQVVLAETPTSLADRRFIALQLLRGGLDVDVYVLHVTWLGEAAPHLLDLGPALGDQIEEHFLAVVAGGQVAGKLLAAPLVADLGLLFYRTDLLAKYGYERPPATWDELEQMAAAIQAGERQANAYFWGFVWQGDDYEGLLANGLEWQISHGGPNVVQPDGAISINHPAAIAALARARGWPGVISSPGVFTYREAEAMRDWRAGDAAFMRHWASAYLASQAEGSVAAGQFAVTPLPHAGGPGVGALGGWSAVVSGRTQQPEAAVAFAQFLASPQVQQLRAEALGALPTRPALYGDPDLLASLPFLAVAGELLAAGDVVILPAAAAGEGYPALSAAYTAAVHGVITGRWEAEQAVAELEQELPAILKQAVDR